MSCENCLKNCGTTQTSDKCVVYTGDDIPLLGVCNGDSLFEVEEVIINKLLEITDGTGIILSELTLDCPFIVALLNGEEQTVSNLVQMLMTAACQTKEQLDALSTQVNASFSISTGCLTLSANPTRDQVLQAIATKLCLMSTSLNAIAADYVKASELCTLVSACISGSGGSQEYTKMPKYIAMPYHGPLSVFDAAGKGIAAAGYDKVYICAGQTVGTFTLPDYRGRSPIGANTNIVGGTLDAVVDPSLIQNSGYSIVPGTKKGAYTDTLVSSTIPAHTHAVVDPGHTHSYTRIDMGSHPGGSSVNRPQTQVTANTTSSTTGITLSSTGGSQPHNNTHPAIGCTFIMYVPI